MQEPPKKNSKLSFRTLRLIYAKIKTDPPTVVFKHFKLQILELLFFFLSFFPCVNLTSLIGIGAPPSLTVGGTSCLENSPRIGQSPLHYTISNVLALYKPDMEICCWYFYFILIFTYGRIGIS